MARACRGNSATRHSALMPSNPRKVAWLPCVCGGLKTSYGFSMSPIAEFIEIFLHCVIFHRVELKHETRLRIFRNLNMIRINVCFPTRKGSLHTTDHCSPLPML